MNNIDLSQMGGGAEARSIMANAEVLKTLNEFNQRTNVYVTEFEETSSGWWRKWSNGLIEQGGVLHSSITSLKLGNARISLRTPFSSSDYSFVAAVRYTRVANDAAPVYAGTVYSKTSTVANVTVEDKTLVPEIYWYASGF